MATMYNAVLPLREIYTTCMHISQTEGRLQVSAVQSLYVYRSGHMLIDG